MDAKIRITTESAQAVKGLRDVAAAGKEAVASVSGTGGAKPFEAFTTGAQQAADATKDAVKEAQALAEQQKLGAAEAAARAAAAKKQAQDQKSAAEDALKAQRAAANQARQLGPQLTDIVVGLSTGQSPFTVLLQQGGQLKDVFGGVGNAGRALFSIFTLGRVVVGGFAAALAAVAVAAVQGRTEEDALNKSLALTGNIVALNAGAFGSLAKDIAASQKASIGSARDTLSGLIDTGEFTSTTLASAGKASLALSKLTGQSAADSIKQFDGMSSGVANWAAKSNQAYNFLSVEQYKYIQSLEAQGRTQDAMKVALDALSTTMEQRAAPAVGTLERLWSGVKKAVSDTVDALKEIGRDASAEAAVDSLSKKLAELDARRTKLLGKQDRTSQLELGNLDAQRAQLQGAVDVADAEVAANSRANKRIAAEKELEQQNIVKESKGYQDALSAVTEAGTQKILGQQLAALDRRQAALDLSNARGLLSERQYNVELNSIEQQRLEAQAATVQRQIAIAAGRKVTRPEDALANQAQVESLTGQLAQIQGQIAAAASKGRAIVEADTLDTARQRATDWAQIWQRADDQVRQFAIANGATQAAAIADPLTRASAEAVGKVAELQRQVSELQRDLDLRLSLTIDPGQRAVLQGQIQALATQAKTSIEEQTRTATFSSLQQQFSDLNQALALQEQRLQTLVDQGALTVIQAEQRKFAARAAMLPQLEAIANAQAKLGVTQGERNVVEQTAQDVLKLKDTTTDFQRSLKDAGIGSFTTELGNIQSGAKTAKQGLIDMVSGFAKSWADLLNKRLGEQFYDQLSQAASKFAAQNSGGWLSTLLGFFGYGGGSASTASTASAGSGTGAIYAHTGAVIGGSGGWRQTVPAAAFSYAPRYHTGGIAGFKPNEVPAVLTRGEEVLTEDDPRHVRNGGGSAAINGLSINVSVSGAQGSEADQRTAAGQLTQQVTAVIDDWAARQSRQGGILARK